ncbi:hypothetical protein SPFM20_00279 [Salmonella phage SPFM20]|nr:hypothetical protein SPFM8_00279 [Salmonella phage SPFM8]VFR14957.1 hypothetical protein SPFM20_00279 [Salmonella phage SPFM20]
MRFTVTLDNKQEIDDLNVDGKPKVAADAWIRDVQIIESIVSQPEDNVNKYTYLIFKGGYEMAKSYMDVMAEQKNIYSVYDTPLKGQETRVIILATGVS